MEVTILFLFEFNADFVDLFFTFAAIVFGVRHIVVVFAVFRASFKNTEKLKKDTERP